MILNVSKWPYWSTRQDRIICSWLLVAKNWTNFFLIYAFTVSIPILWYLKEKNHWGTTILFKKFQFISNKIEGSIFVLVLGQIKLFDPRVRSFSSHLILGQITFIWPQIESWNICNLRIAICVIPNLQLEWI